MALSNGRRLREGGQTQILVETHIVNKDDQEKIFMKEIQRVMEFLGYTRQYFLHVEGIFRKLEKEQNCICPTALVLTMRYVLDLHHFTYVNSGKTYLLKFLKEEWKKINDIIEVHGIKYFENYSSSISRYEDCLRFRIYKNKILPSHHLDRYIALWQREIMLHNIEIQKNYIKTMNNRENNQLVREDFVKLRNRTIPYISNVDKHYNTSLLQVKAENGKNACWINTVLFIFFSKAELRHCMIYNKYIMKENIDYLKYLLNQVWNDNLYIFYYKIFKANCDDVVRYGQYGDPHMILSFIIHEIINKNIENLKVELDFIIDIDSYEKLKNYVDSGNHYAIIKGTSKISNVEMNMTEEINCDHFVAYIQQEKEDWMFFDAMKGGVERYCVTLADVFHYDQIDCDRREGACPYYFIRI